MVKKCVLNLIQDGNKIIDGLIVYANVKNNKISYTEEQVDVILEVFDNRVLMERKTNEYILNIEFSMLNSKKADFKLLYENESAELELITEKLKIVDSCINIWYKLEDNYFNFRLEVID